MTYPVTVTLTYPERVSGSSETGEVHAAYNFFYNYKAVNSSPGQHVPKFNHYMSKKAYSENPG